MQNITPPLSTLGAAAAAGVTITAMPKSPHSELASTDSALIAHALSPDALASQPVACPVATAGGKYSKIPLKFLQEFSPYPRK